MTGPAHRPRCVARAETLARKPPAAHDAGVTGLRPQSSSRAAATALLLVALALAACSPIARTPAAVAGAPGRQAPEGERAYRTPPSVVGAQLAPGARVRLDGLADPGSRVRLSTPSGQALIVRVDAAGRWRATLPQSPALRLFGLSMIGESQVVQSESYLALTPAGIAVRLRSGAGAVALGAPCVLCLTALDYDRKGGAVVSGRAQAGEIVALAVDGVLRGRVAADSAGRFFFDLDEPLAPGAHRLQAQGRAGPVLVDVQLQPPPPLADGPFLADRNAAQWRIEWVTPGGGVQTTLLFDRNGARA